MSFSEEGFWICIRRRWQQCSRGGNLFEDIVQKTEPGVWYQFTRDERGERLVHEFLVRAKEKF